MRKTIAIILCLFLPASGWPFSTQLARHWSFKPPVGTPINRGHPLARGLIGCWLFNEGGGPYQKDLASGGVATLQNGASPWVTDQLGDAIDYEQNTANWAKEPFPDTRFPITIVAIFTLHDLTQVVGGRLMFHDNDSLNTAGFGLRFTSANPSVMRFTVNAQGDVDFSNLTINTKDVYYFAAVTVTSGAGTLTGYLARLGQPLVSQSPAFTLNLGAAVSTEIEIGNIVAQGVDHYGHISEILFYNRVLSAGEIQRLNFDPWVFMQPPGQENALVFPAPAALSVMPSMNMLGIGGQL